MFYKVVKLTLIHSFDHNLSSTDWIEVIQIALETRLEYLSILGHTPLYGS